MNKRQRIALLVGLVLFALFMLFPSWRKSTLGVPGWSWHAGRHFLLYPSWYRPATETSTRITYHVDLPRLGIEVGFVAVLTASAIVLLHKR